MTTPTNGHQHAPATTSNLDQPPQPVGPRPKGGKTRSNTLAGPTARFGGWSLAGPISAALMILAFPVFPRFQLWPLAWVALAPLLCCLFRGGWKTGLRQGVFFGYPFMVGVLAWVWWMGIAPWLLLAATQAAYVTVFTLITATLAPLWTAGMNGSREHPRPWLRHAAALVLPAAAWVFMEWLRSLGRLSIPWGFVSTTQVHLPPLVSTARWWGAYGVSFLIVMVNGGVANCLLSRGRDRSRAAVVLAVAVVIVPLACLASVLSLHLPQGQPMKVALIQGNLPKESVQNKNDLNDAKRIEEYQNRVIAIYGRLSLQAAAKHADVIVWPETEIPGYFFRDFRIHTLVTGIARMTHAYLLAGSPDTTPGGQRFNASALIDPTGAVLGRYDKEHIVPFGEFVPGRSWLPFLDFYGVPAVDLSPGKGHIPIDTPAGRMGVMICYESMYPQIARQTVQHDADVLLVITNDEWFGTSSAPFDHAAATAFRAAETGRWVAQAGSTGISLFADPAGHTYGRTTMFTKAVDVWTVRRLNGTTFYTRWGDWPPLCAIPLLLVALCFRGMQGYWRVGPTEPLVSE